MRTWTWHGKLGGLRLLRFFDTSLHCQDTMEDDLSIFQVRSLTRHGKLGGVRLLRFFDTSLRCRDMMEDDLSNPTDHQPQPDPTNFRLAKNC